MDACFAVAVFLLGAACGALLARIAHTGFEDRLRHGLALEPLVDVENENLRPRKAELRNPAYPCEISPRGSKFRKLARRRSHSKNLGE